MVYGLESVAHPFAGFRFTCVTRRSSALWCRIRTFSFVLGPGSGAFAPDPWTHALGGS